MNGNKADGSKIQKKFPESLGELAGNLPSADYLGSSQFISILKFCKENNTSFEILLRKAFFERLSEKEKDYLADIFVFTKRPLRQFTSVDHACFCSLIAILASQHAAHEQSELLDKFRVKDVEIFGIVFALLGRTAYQLCYETALSSKLPLAQMADVLTKMLANSIATGFGEAMMELKRRKEIQKGDEDAPTQTG